MLKSADKMGSVGAVIAAAACPICFPKLAAIGALFGLGALAPFEVYFLIGAQVLVLIALAGQLIAYRRLGNLPVLVFSVTSTVIFFASLYVVVSEVLSYVSLAGIVAASVWLVIAERRGVRCGDNAQGDTPGTTPRGV